MGLIRNNSDKLALGTTLQEAEINAANVPKDNVNRVLNVVGEASKK